MQPGNILRKHVEARGMTLAELGERLGLDPGYLSKVGHGRIIPSVLVAVRIARELGVPVDEIWAQTKEAA